MPRKSQELLSPEAIRTLRQFIREAKGAEIFAIGKVEEGITTKVELHATGTRSEVLAFSERARPGDVLIHNHPSGVLEPSPNDLLIADLSGRRGVGFYIIDNEVRKVQPVVLPYKERSPELPDPMELEGIFRPKGGLERVLPTYTFRPGQLKMAESIRELFREGGVLLIEAGTGVGKSLAYLVPSILYALKNPTTIIVSTGTLTLQDQILHKDLPILNALFPSEIRVTTIKGRSNYVSLRRAKLLRENTPLLLDEKREAELTALEGWLAQTEVGEISDLPFEPSPEIWEEIQSEADNCLKVRCPHYGECFFFQSRRRAASAHIVVVNHAILSLDLILRRSLNLGFDEAVLLPPYSFLILDEAHLFPEILLKQMGIQLSLASFLRPINQLLHLDGKRGKLLFFRQRITDRIHAFTYTSYDAFTRHYDEVLSLHRTLAEKVQALFSRAQEFYRQKAKDEPIEIPSTLPGYEDLLSEAHHFENLVQKYRQSAMDLLNRLPPSLREELEGVESELVSKIERLSQNAVNLLRILSGTLEGSVAWMESYGKRESVRFASQPLGADRFFSSLIHELKGIVMTSATLTTSGGDFRYFLRKLGLDQSSPPSPKTLLIPSPFDYARNACLAVVRGFFGEGKEHHLIEAIYKLILVSKGRALVLTTRQDLVTSLGRALKPLLEREGIQLFAQGLDGHPSQLLKRFLANPHSVLIGTNTFWEGVDAPGETLLHVILVKLPFPLFTHPYERARERTIREQGGDPFLEESLPRAILRFRQGFGRLIRSENDWGAVTILDDRVVERWYGRLFLSALPDLPVYTGELPEILERLASFFKEREESTAKRSRSQGRRRLRG